MQQQTFKPSDLQENSTAKSRAKTNFSKAKIIKIIPNCKFDINNKKEYNSSIYIAGTCSNMPSYFSNIKRRYYSSSEEDRNTKKSVISQDLEILFKIFDKYDPDNCKIVLVETYPCTEKGELWARVEYHRELLYKGKEFERVQIEKVNFFTCNCGMYVDRADRDYHMITITHTKGVERMKLIANEQRRARKDQHEKQVKKKLKELDVKHERSEQRIKIGEVLEFIYCDTHKIYDCDECSKK